MSRKTKTKTGYLKVIEWGAVNHKRCSNMENALRAALSKPESAREWKPSPDSNVRRVVVQIQDNGGFISGRFVEFEVGKKPEVLQKSVDSTKHYKVIPSDVAEAPRGYENEVLNDSMFFSVKGDSMRIMQSVGLKASSLEDHINWLLMSKPEGWSEGRILLANHVPEDIPAKIKKVGVDNLVIGLEIGELFEQDIPDGIGTVDVIEGLLGNLALKSSWASKLTKSVKEERFGGIKTSVTISLLKSGGDRALNLVNALALGMRDDASGVTLVLRDGEIIKGEELVRTGKFKVEYFDGNPAVTQVYSGLKGIT